MDANDLSLRNPTCPLGSRTDSRCRRILRIARLAVSSTVRTYRVNIWQDTDGCRSLSDLSRKRLRAKQPNPRCSVQPQELSELAAPRHCVRRSAYGRDVAERADRRELKGTYERRLVPFRSPARRDLESVRP